MLEDLTEREHFLLLTKLKDLVCKCDYLIVNRLSAPSGGGRVESKAPTNYKIKYFNFHW